MPAVAAVPVGGARHRGFDGYLLFPLAVPLALVAAGNDAFGFDPAGWLDAFMYAGYFWHYPEHVAALEDHYKISRLPWILPGYLAHQLWGVVGASLALAYATTAGSAAGLYLLVREALADRRAAAVVAVAWACCTGAHGVGGWNYQVLAASGYYLAAAWLVVRAARRATPATSAAPAGALLASALHTHLLLVMLVPLLALLYWAARPPGRAPSSDARAAAWLATGALALTLVLAAVNGATGGAWLFFMPQITQAQRLAVPGNNPWWIADVAAWLPSARYLVVPTACLVLGLVGAISGRRQPDARMRVMLVGTGWGALAVMAYFQFFRQQTILDYSYMAFILYVHAFPCAAVALADTPLPRTRPWQVLAAAAVLLGSLLTLLPGPWPALLPRAFGALGTAPITAPLVVGVAGAVATAFVPRGLRVFVFAVWFTALNLWVVPDVTAYGVRTPGSRREMLTLFREMDRFTANLDPTLIGIKFWLSQEQVPTARGDVALAPLFDSFVATRTWQPNLLARTSPGVAIASLTVEDLDRGACVGILSSPGRQAELAAAMTAQVAELGRPPHVVAAGTFASGELTVALTVIRIQNSEFGIRAAPCSKPAPDPAH